VNSLCRHRPLSDTIVARSERMRALLAVVEKVAPLTVPVCVIGEPGTGRGLIARAIHFNSPRSNRPFVEVDCAAIPARPVHLSPGAAHPSRVIAKASTGTLFIDHVAEMPARLQARVLSLVRSPAFRRPAETKPTRNDVRLITATTAGLETAVAAGRFREDLYYSIRVVSIHVPPLRERKEDIPVLVDHFLRRSTLLHGRTHRALSRRALDFLVDYSWPGNVRQLEEGIERAVVMAKGSVIDLPLLAESCARTVAGPDRPQPAP